jgi:hypothetical protein
MLFNCHRRAKSCWIAMWFLATVVPSAPLNAECWRHRCFCTSSAERASEFIVFERAGPGTAYVMVASYDCERDALQRMFALQGAAAQAMYIGYRYDPQQDRLLTIKTVVPAVANSDARRLCGASGSSSQCVQLRGVYK